VGKAEKEDDSWLVRSGWNNEPLEYRYLMSLHWSIAQFQGGMDEIVPVGHGERIYAVCASLICFVLAAAFVSALTSEMTRLHILASQQARQLNVLHRFLKQCRISDKLSYRVQRNAQHAISEQQRLMPESEVELLAMVSEPLKIELHFEMYSPVVEVHPFMSDYIFECPQVMRKVCHEAMSALLIASGDVIFNAGEMPSFPKMYIVCSGTLEYIPLSGQVVEVHQEHWLSEACLWTRWMHRGVLKTTTEGRLGVLDATKFQLIVATFDQGELDARRYATAFVKYLNNLIDMEELEKITDMPLGEEDRICRQAHAGAVRRSTAKGQREALKQFFHSRKSAFMDPTRQTITAPSVTIKTMSQSVGLKRPSLFIRGLPEQPPPDLEPPCESEDGDGADVAGVASDPAAAGNDGPTK
jgi:hypothetical protein